MSSGLESKQARCNSEMVTHDTKFVTKSATCTLKVYEQLVYIDSTSAVTITLPPVAEACGKLYVLYVSVFSQAITIAAADSGDFSAPTFNGADDGALYYSDGVHWWPLSVRT